MATVYNTAGSISAVMNNIWEVALLTARENTIMAALVKSDFGPYGGMNGRAWATYSGATWGTIPESQDMGTASSAFTPSAAGTFTPYIYAASYFLTDMRIASDPFGVARDAGTDLGQLAAVGVDSALCGTSIFRNLTAGTVGATVTAMSWANVLKASAYIRAQKAAGPYACVLHPAQWYDLAASTSCPSLLQSQRLMDEFGQFYMASWAGINFFVDANITDTSGTVYGGMFARDAIGLDIRRPFRIESQRDASVGGGAIELNASMVFAYGTFRPAFGALISGASY